MRSLFQIIVVAVIGIALAYGIGTLWPPSAVNPDANHAHADFAVWIDGKQLDFSDSKFMSGSSAAEEEGGHPHKHLHEFLHVHDGNGHVIHRHKPGLLLGDFFDSLPGFTYKEDPFSVFRIDGKELSVQLYVNGVPELAGSAYVFKDGDHLLITNAGDPAEVAKELSLMTDDACLYSKTCPWRGQPPAEGCIADPTVPCRE